MLVLLVNCNQYVSHKKNIQNNKNIITTEGTIKYIKLEGGFFGIITENGNKYVPINLTRDFQVDEFKVKFEGKLRPDLFSIHMWGKLIEIIKIKEK
jgi:hypothetical protein